MTVKEVIVDAMVTMGYDFFTACESYESWLKEFKASDKREDYCNIMIRGKCVASYLIRKN